MLVHVAAVAAVVAQCAGLKPALALLATAVAVLLAVGPREAASTQALGFSPRVLVGGLAAALCALIAARTLSPPAGQGSVLALLAGQARSPSKLRIYAEVVRTAAGASGSARLIVRALAVGEQRRSLSGGIRLSIAHCHRNWRMGERMAFSAWLRRITNLGNPGEFDFAGWNARRGIWVSAFVWDDDEIVDLGAGSSWALGARARVRRAALSASPRRGATLVAALITGDRSGLDAATVAAVRAAGLSHILAISGLHTGIVVGFILSIGRRLLPRTRLARAGYDTVRGAAWAAAAGLAAYVTLSGGGVAVTRSTIMATIFLALLWWGRGGNGVRALAWAALSLCVAVPGIAREAGFQLSFAAVAAILVCMPAVVEASGGSSTIQRVAIAATGLSFVCWWVTTPIVAHYFYRISIPGVVVNPIVSPLVAVVVVLGLAAAALLAVAAPAAAVLFDLAAKVAAVVLVVADEAAGLPGAGLAVVDPGWPIVVALAALPLVVALTPPWRGRVGAGLVCVIVAVGASAVYGRYRSDRMDIYFVAIGQGDATVVRLPGGDVMVVDGGSPGRGRSVLVPVLRRLQVATIDYLVVTHAQADHWGGLADLTPEFTLGELWQATAACHSPGYSRFVDDLKAAGVSVASKPPPLVRGRQGWSIEMLWPPTATGECGDNDESLVLALEFAGSRVLLTGDIERRGEARLLATGRSLHAEVLKIPHHGSRTSSSPALVEAVRPRVAVASVGFLNRYGFPHAEVERRYAALGAKLFRTDRDGAVHVAIDATGVSAAAAK